jgi:hypothetical protein
MGAAFQYVMVGTQATTPNVCAKFQNADGLGSPTGPSHLIKKCFYVSQGYMYILEDGDKRTEQYNTLLILSIMIWAYLKRTRPAALNQDKHEQTIPYPSPRE